MNNFIPLQALPSTKGRKKATAGGTGDQCGLKLTGKPSLASAMCMYTNQNIDCGVMFLRLERECTDHHFQRVAFFPSRVATYFF
jgi:hypothetical protein